jgi:transcriptional regulator with XRE-family HTH domain
MPRSTFRQSAKPRSELALFLKFLRSRIDPEARVLGSYVRLSQRLGKRVTQEELAEAIGIGREWYAVLESVGTTRASPALMERMADTLMATPEERANLFHLAVPEFAGVQLRGDSIAALEGYSRLRSLTKRLWGKTSIEDVLTTASEHIADWFDGALLVRSTRRGESGLWEARSVDDKQNRNNTAKALADLADHVLRTTGSLDASHLYPRLANPGDVGTPDLWPLPVQQEALKFYARHRIAGIAGLYARVQSYTGFNGALYVVHEFGHSYSASDRAVLGAIAELACFALS